MHKYDHHAPVHGHSREIEHTGRHCDDGEEIVDDAVEVPKRPAHVSHVDVVEDGVEGGHEEVAEGHVGQEGVGDGAHPRMGWNECT